MVDFTTPLFMQTEEGVLARVIDGPDDITLYERYDGVTGEFVEDFEYVYAVTQGRDPDDDFEYQDHKVLSEAQFEKRVLEERTYRAEQLGLLKP